MTPLCSSVVVTFLLSSLCAGALGQFVPEGATLGPCQAGDIYLAGGFFPVPCIACVNVDGTDLCVEGDTGCQFNNDPVDPDCAGPSVTEEPIGPPPCQPGDDPPFPSIGGICFACLNVDTLRQCAGDERETCTWLDCADETTMTTKPSGQLGSTISSAQLGSTIPSAQLGSTIPSAQLGSTIPSAPEICMKCLNVDTTETCVDVEGERCDWYPCEDSVNMAKVTDLPGEYCQPGATYDIPDLPECSLRCFNENGELCGYEDNNCRYELLDFDACLNGDYVTPGPTLTTDDGTCQPGAELPIKEGCTLECYNATYDGLCQRGEDGCQWRITPGCLPFFAPSTPTTTPSPPACKPGDKPPLPRTVSCVLCVNGTWRTISNSPCPGCSKPEICPQRDRPANCRTCRCLNDDCRICQKESGEKCAWHNNVDECKASKMRRLSLTFETENCAHIISDEFRKQEFLDQVKLHIKNSTGVYPKDFQIACGSIIVIFTIAEEDGQSLDLDEITEQIKEQIERGDLSIIVDGQEYGNATLTIVTMEVTTASPSPKASSPSPKPSTNMLATSTVRTVIIITVVVAVLLLGIIIAIPVWIVRSSSETNDKEKQLKDSPAQLEGYYTEKPTAPQMKT